jgi:hypothetical protein
LFTLFYQTLTNSTIRILYHQMAAWVPNMSCNFYFLKNHKIADNSTTTKAKEKIVRIWNIYNFRKESDEYLTEFKNNKFLLNKIGCQFLLTTKQLTGWNITSLSWFILLEKVRTFWRDQVIMGYNLKGCSGWVRLS